VRRTLAMTNLNTTQQIYEAFGRGDVPAIVDLCAEDVAWEHWEDNWAQKKGIPVLQERTGKAGVGEFFAAVGTLTMQSFDVLNIMEGGNQVAVTFVIEYDTPVGGHLRDRGDAPLDVRPGRQGIWPPSLRRHGQAPFGLEALKDNLPPTAANRRADKPAFTRG